MQSLIKCVAIGISLDRVIFFFARGVSIFFLREASSLGALDLIYHF